MSVPIPANGGAQPALLIGLFRLPDGGLSVSGPVDDAVAAYGLLELAKQLVAEHQRQIQQRRVVPAAVLPPILRGA
jgi:hypothetical protein